MRIYAGPVEGRDVVAATWIPGDDVISSEFVWAALDCPGAYAVQSGARGDPVLGRLAARVEHLPHPGERCIVIGWPLGEDGRKLYAGTALFGEDGRVLGAARATWILPATNPQPSSTVSDTFRRVRMVRPDSAPFSPGRTGRIDLNWSLSVVAGSR